MKFSSALLVVMVLLSVGACKNKEGGNPAMQKLNIAYGLDARQVMDVYFPADYSRQSKVVFLLHGGGFEAGSKNDFMEVSKQFRDLGYIAVNVEYRFIDTAGIQRLPPAHQSSAVMVNQQLEDINAAVKKYKKMAPDWGLSDSRMYIAGHSIGALLSMLYLQSDYNEARIIRAAGNWAGITDLALTHDSVLEDLDPRYIELMYRATGVMPGVARNLSFMAISPMWTLQNNNCFPVFSAYPDNNIVYNTPGESAWGYRRTQAYHDSIKANHVPQQIVRVDSTNHLFTAPKNRWKTVVQQTADFFFEN